MNDSKPPKLGPNAPPALGRSSPPRIQNQVPRSVVPGASMRRIVRSQAGKSQSSAVVLVVAAVGVLGLIILGGSLFVRFVNTEVRTKQNLATTDQTKTTSRTKRVTSPSSQPSPVTAQPSSGNSRTTVIGIPSDLMTYCAAKQEKQNWCWAACIQMVYSTQGIKVSQENIVKATLGVAVDVPGGLDQFMEALKGWKPSQSGRKSLEASIYPGSPQLSTLTLSLKNKTPVILAISYPGQDVGHAVVITAVHLEASSAGKELTREIIRDPDPSLSSQKGKRELSPDEFKNSMWHIIVDSL